MALLSSFPPLPTELIREMFEFAAIDDRQAAITLTLVSSHVRQWTLPFLYHSVVLSSPRSLNSFLGSISTPHDGRTSKLTPIISLRRRVRNLGIFALGSMRAIEAIIASCTEVKSLACGFSLQGLTQCSPIGHVNIPQVREQHLLGLSCRDGFDLSVLVPTISYLNLQLTSGTLSLLPQVPAYLPALTHLAITAVSPPSDLRDALCLALQSVLECSTLEVLLIQDTSFTGISRLKEDIDRWNIAPEDVDTLRDVRVVAQKVSTSPVKQWEEGVLNGKWAPSLWEEAVLEVHERNARALASQVRERTGDS